MPGLAAASAASSSAGVDYSQVHYLDKLFLNNVYCACPFSSSGSADSLQGESSAGGAGSA